MHPLGTVNSLSGQLQLPLPKEDDCSFWQLSVKARTKKDYAPMLRETRGRDGFLNRPKLASLKHRRFLTEAAPSPACGPSPLKGAFGLAKSQISSLSPLPQQGRGTEYEEREVDAEALRGDLSPPVTPFPPALSGKSRSAGWETGGLR
jgi:hypothetical protein